MKSELYDQIEKDEKGEEYGQDSVTFTNKEPDLWLAFRNADYTVEIEEETRQIGFWFIKLNISQSILRKVCKKNEKPKIFTFFLP